MKWITWTAFIFWITSASLSATCSSAASKDSSVRASGNEGDFEIRNSKFEMNLVFMGTATFAIPTLQKLFEGGFRISGVITQPDKPSGRGQALQQSPVKRKALDLN